MKLGTAEALFHARWGFDDPISEACPCCGKPLDTAPTRKWLRWNEACKRVEHTVRCEACYRADLRTRKRASDLKDVRRLLRQLQGVISNERKNQNYRPAP